jgi:PRTRC genetic system ThiF family protein
MYKILFETIRKDAAFVVVGCGGTGGFVAEGLARILPLKYPIILQDGDTVEESNLCRQNFFRKDLGMFKSEALANRLSTNYKRPIGFKTNYFRQDSYEAVIVYIGCVDNAFARNQISRSHDRAWWIDSGNGHHSGQVLIGNADYGDMLKGTFYPNHNLTKALPKPSIQLPSILAPPISIRASGPTGSCAEMVESEEQSPVINQMMAVLVLQAVHALVRDELTWMSAYVDLEAGTLRTIPIEPETVARIAGVRVDTLFNNNEPRRE